MKTTTTARPTTTTTSGEDKTLEIVRWFNEQCGKEILEAHPDLANDLDLDGSAWAGLAALMEGIEVPVATHEGASLTVSGIGKKEDTLCVTLVEPLLVDRYGFSAGTIDRIGGTRALDGELSATSPEGWEVFWRYHPDEGLSLVIDKA